MTLRQRIRNYLLNLLYWGFFDAIVREEFDKIGPLDPEADLALTPEMEARIDQLLEDWTI